MKIFDPRAALAEIQNRGGTPATSATSATQTPETGDLGQNVAKVASVAAPPGQIGKPAPTPATSATQGPDTGANVAKVVNVATLHPENQESATSDMRHGFAVSGNPKTWTGNVVSLSEWRGLSEWQRHGPNGRMWCGACRAWVSECEHTPEGSR